MKTLGRLCWLIAIFLIFPAVAFSGDNSYSFDFGLGIFNKGKPTRTVESGPHSFIQAVYLYEKPFSARELASLVEPSGVNANRQDDGSNTGFDLSLKYYPFRADRRGFYLTAGPGMTYTTLGLKEQGGQLLFVVQGGIGYRYGSFFLEDKLRHYSNGTSGSPNWSMSTNILSIGGNF